MMMPRQNEEEEDAGGGSRLVQEKQEKNSPKIHQVMRRKIGVCTVSPCRRHCVMQSCFGNSDTMWTKSNSCQLMGEKKTK